MNDNLLLALRDATFGYEPGRAVLRGATLEIRSGDRIGLTGRNGAGKSTLLHLLVGLLRPRAGGVTAFGQERRTEADFVEVRRRVALLFQDSEDQLFCPTVIEDVAFGPLNLGRPPAAARRDADAALARVGLGDYGGRVTHHLSVGEKKLVALASILAMQPAALLLDEPTAGLDENAAERVARILETTDAAFLVISQDRAFLDRVCRRRLGLRDGTVEAE